MYRDRAMHDHLWGERDNNSQEQKYRNAISYQEELKRQIEEKASRKRALEDDYWNSGNKTNQNTTNSYNSPIQRNQYSNYSPDSPPRRTNQNQMPSYPISPRRSNVFSPNSGPLPMSTFGSSISASGAKNAHFAESLRAQIESATRSGSVSEVSIPPLSTITPSVPQTFSTATHFDEAKFEFSPNMTRSFRGMGVGGGSRISPITMHSTSAVRSEFNSNFDSVPRVEQTELRKSKVVTPQMGFSMRASLPNSTWGTNDFSSTI